MNQQRNKFTVTPVPGIKVTPHPFTPLAQEIYDPTMNGGRQCEWPSVRTSEILKARGGVGPNQVLVDMEGVGFIHSSY